MKRGTYKDRAIVLNSVDYGESDRILTFYTLGRGKMSGIAKGARRSRKRFVGNLDPASHIDILFFHNGTSDLARVEDASLIDAFPGIRGDIERYSEACYMLELSSEMTREGQALPALYRELAAFLKMLEGAPGPECLRFFEIRLLSHTGYLPHLNGCVVCRKAHEGERLFFSSDRGGTVCRGCATGISGLVPVSPGTAGLLSMAARLEEGKLTRLRPDQAFLDESERILSDFIKFQLGKELKTRRFMAKLRMAGCPA